MMGNSQSLDDMVSASGMYALLARLWLQEIDSQFVAQLRQPTIRDAFHAAGGVTPGDDDIEDLAAEYCRLFIGPKDHLPPFQSVWAQGSLQSEVTDSVKLFAEALNYPQATAHTNTMLDHLGIQLDIMACAQRLAGSDSNTEQLRELTAEFYRRHLTWPHKLITTAKARCNHPFYESVLHMTEDFLLGEANR